MAKRKWGKMEKKNETRTNRGGITPHLGDRRRVRGNEIEKQHAENSKSAINRVPEGGEQNEGEDTP